jgi:hypothetical protein
MPTKRTALRASLGTALQGITGQATGTVSLLPQPPHASHRVAVVPVLVLLLVAWLAVVLTR